MADGSCDSGSEATPIDGLKLTTYFGERDRLTYAAVSVIAGFGAVLLATNLTRRARVTA